MMNKEILKNGKSALSVWRLIDGNVVFGIASDFLKELGIKYEEFNLSFTDMPGLNDSQTSETFYGFLRHTFDNRFDPRFYFGTFILLVDINQGMNTEDSVKVIDFLKDCFTKYPDYVANLVVVINKCDEMSYKDGKLVLKSKQLQEMEKQIKETINSKLVSVTNLSVCFQLISAKHVMQDRAEDISTLEEQDIDIDGVLLEMFSKRQI
jgi:GTP-binding protein EngB required for normal cell division